MIFAHPETGYAQKAFSEAGVIGKCGFQIKSGNLYRLIEHANAGWSQASVELDSTGLGRGLDPVKSKILIIILILTLNLQQAK